MKRKQRKEGGKKAGVPAKAKRDLAVSPTVFASVPCEAGIHWGLLHVSLRRVTASLGLFALERMQQKRSPKASKMLSFVYVCIICLILPGMLDVIEVHFAF